MVVGTIHFLADAELLAACSFKASRRTSLPRQSFFSGKAWTHLG